MLTQRARHHHGVVHTLSLIFLEGFLEELNFHLMDVCGESMKHDPPQYSTHLGCLVGAHTERGGDLAPGHRAVRVPVHEKALVTSVVSRQSSKNAAGRCKLEPSLKSDMPLQHLNLMSAFIAYNLNLTFTRLSSRHYNVTRVRRSMKHA